MSFVAVLTYRARADALQAQLSWVDVDAQAVGWTMDVPFSPNLGVFPEFDLLLIGHEHEGEDVLDVYRLGERTEPGSRERDLVTLGLLAATAALARCESRGAHYRRDFPETAAGARRRLSLRTDPTGLDPRLLPAAAGATAARGLK